MKQTPMGQVCACNNIGQPVVIRATSLRITGHLRTSAYIWRYIVPKCPSQNVHLRASACICIYNSLGSSGCLGSRRCICVHLYLLPTAYCIRQRSLS